MVFQNSIEALQDAHLLQLQRYRLGILGLSEVRKLDSGEHFSPFYGTEWLYSGGTKCGSDVRLIPLGEPFCPGDRMLFVTFRSKMRNISIVQNYATTNTYDAEEKQGFYEEVNAVQKRFPKGDIGIVMRNLNAEVGSDNTFLF